MSPRLRKGPESLPYCTADARAFSDGNEKVRGGTCPAANLFRDEADLDYAQAGAGPGAAAEGAVKWLGDLA